ncbi:MAG TPA: ABC transporter ATP-binding protein, partial [Clostridiales bacterium]|nr:ABC transporter ATP-binding protein [Clostridiales bacterium]
EQQMLAIARALVSDPKLLLMDEPSMGLSPKLVGEVFDIIVDLKNQGITILLVEQNAHMALNIADYAYVIQTGEIVISGTGRDMIANDEVRKAYLSE